MASDDPLIGKQVGNYRILAEINSGSFGKVYQGKHVIFEDDPVVAIKLLHTALRSPQEHTEFIREARILKKLNHPHILRILDAGFQDGIPYLVTEYAAGGSLRSRLNKANRKPLPLDETTQILTQVGQALYYAHEQHISHRDLKPENILFNQEGEALLADFGIAILLESTGTDKVGVGGTPLYMAPEQFEGLVSPKSDQYALGCIAYELVTGRRLFIIPNPTLETYWYHHVKVEPIPPTHYNPQLPAYIEEAILRALAKDRSRRYNTILQFSEALLKKLSDIMPVVSKENGLKTLSEDSNKQSDKVDKIASVPEQTQVVESSVPQEEHTEDLKKSPVSDRASGDLHQQAEIDLGYLSPRDHIDQPLSIPSNGPASSGSLTVPRARSRGVQVPPLRPASRNVTTRPVSQSSRPQQPPMQSRPMTRSRIPATPPPRRVRPASGPRGRTVTVAVIATLILFLLIGVGLFYYGTAATVTITVPSKTITLNSFQLVASTDIQSKFPNSVTSQVLTDAASISGTGTATGLTSQGNAVASGIVNFTNNGQQVLTVPTNTVLTTNGGTGTISFVTTANVVVPPTSSSTPYMPTPVKAQNPGSSGNIAANTITVLPPTSLAAIAQASNLSTSQINLSVTNPAPLTGGGATQMPTATQNDLQALKSSLHLQLQNQIKAWLQQQLHQGDIAGKFFPDVVDSEQPLPEEQLTQVPAVGVALPDKTFSATLNVIVNVLVVRYNNLVAAAQHQLNTAAEETGPNPYTCSTQSSIHTNVLSSSPSVDGKSITITISASGQAVLQVDTRAMSAFLAGKTKDEAISAVNAGDAGPRGVENVDITISPLFLSIMPFRPDNIHIVVISGTPSSVANT